MGTTWLLTGSPENWIIGIARGFWGVNDEKQNTTYWVQVNEGDIGIFHSTKKSAYCYIEPMIIGYAVIGEKHYRKKDWWWLDEVKSKRNKWPYVFSLDEIYTTLGADYDEFKDCLKNSKKLSPKKEDKLRDNIFSLPKSAIKYSDFSGKPKLLVPGIKNFTDQRAIQKIDPKYHEYLETLNFVRYEK